VGDELLLICARAAHMLAAAAWVGGAIVYAIVGRPNLGTGKRSFPWLVGVCAWVLMLSGAVLTFDRLTGARASTLYALLLALKVGLALALFLLAGTLVPRRIVRARAPPTSEGGAWWLTTPFVILWVGVVIYALGASLAVVYTRDLIAAGY
jgi:putative copper export protein